MQIPSIGMTDQMKFYHGCYVLRILIAICAALASATTELSFNSTISATSVNAERDSTTLSPAHPSIHLPTTAGELDRNSTAFSQKAGVPLDGSASPVPQTTDDNGNNLGTATSTPGYAMSLNTGTTEGYYPKVLEVSTEAQPALSTQPVPMSEDCLCDLTPDFCDIDCCCDTADCKVANLSTLFTGCPQKPLSGVCVEKWLMFRANVDPTLVSVTDSLFCINIKDAALQSPPDLTQLPSLGNSYHFSVPAPLSSAYSRHFYRVDDVIQTYFSNSSVWGVLRQPSPGVVGTFCTNQNPARFLRSTSFSCTRTVTRQSCARDPNLNAYSYFYNMSLVKIPVVELRQVSDFLINVTPQSDWPVPSEHNGSCLNVVEKVEFNIGFTGRGELTYANINVILADVDLDQLLLQTHSVQFQLEADAPSAERLGSAVGLRIGSPVMALFDGKVLPLTTMGVSQKGECSSDPTRRSPILFTFNTFTGCTVRLLPGSCSALRSQIYTILEGLKTSNVLAMTSGSQPMWTRVITQRCPSAVEETCESGCILPKALSIRLLWARQGPLDLPQNYILGAKYLFQCQKFQCPVSSPVILTTEVIFADTTLYPEPPRSVPQPKWKFPFGFFSRGMTELDGHFIMNGSEKVIWSLILSQVMLLTGLEFFT